MPEIFSPELFSIDTRKDLNIEREKGDISSSTIAQILKDDDNYVGEGGRVVVSALENDPDKLVAVSRKETTPDEAKSVYYNHKILEILFPDNFPTIYAGVGKQDGKGVSATFRERVYGRQFTKEETLEMMNAAKEEPTAENLEEGSFARVIVTFKELGIPLNFDRNNRNYMLSDDDKEVYVDTINFRGWTEDMRKNLLDYMRGRKYMATDTEKVDTYISRLMTLGK